jgi:hypothetical protein
MMKGWSVRWASSRKEENSDGVMSDWRRNSPVLVLIEATTSKGSSPRRGPYSLTAKIRIGRKVSVGSELHRGRQCPTALADEPQNSCRQESCSD